MSTVTCPHCNHKHQQIEKPHASVETCPHCSGRYILRNGQTAIYAENEDEE